MQEVIVGGVKRVPTIRAIYDNEPRLERRAHLAKLEAGRRGLATLIEAGAGYGKTGLLALWREELVAGGVAVVSLELTDSHCDPQRLLRAIHDSIGDVSGQATDLGAGALSAPAIGAKLARQRRPVVIMLDRYENASSGPVDQGLADLLETAEGNVHVVVASRSAINIPFGKRRLDGLIERLSGADLKFSEDEVAELLVHDLSEEDRERVMAWTEGWPAAVRILALRYRTGTDAGAPFSSVIAAAEADIAGYIRDEMLAHLSADDRTLLVETAFLEQFGSDLAEAVTGRSEVWRSLEHLVSGMVLEAAGGPGDRQYRCHSLLRRILFTQLERRGRRQLAEKRLAAARWFQSNGDPLAAIPHATDDPDLLASLAMQADMTMIGVRNGTLELRNLLDHVSADSIRRHPRLALAQAFVAAKTGLVDAAAEIVRTVRSRAADEHHQPDHPLFLRDLAIVESSIARYGGRESPTLTVYVEALQRVCLDDAATLAVINNLRCSGEYELGNFAEARSCGEAALHFYGERSMNGLGHVHIHLGRINAQTGDLDAAIRSYRAALGFFLDRPVADRQSGHLASVLLGQALYERGEIEEALELCHAAIDPTDLAEYYHDVLYAGLRTLAIIASVTQSVAEGVRHLDAGIALARTHRITQLERMLELEKLLMDPDAARAAASPSPRASSEDGGDSWRIRDLRALTNGKIATLAGEPTQALEVFERQAMECAQNGRIRNHIDFLVKIALVNERIHRRGAALVALRRAVDLAWRGAIVAPFFENGTEAAALLTVLATDAGLQGGETKEQAFVSGAIRICNEFGAAGRTIFSLREREILHHLAAGLNNKLIARALNISPQTVRFHLKSIYGKFGISNGHANRRVVTDFANLHGLR